MIDNYDLKINALQRMLCPVELTHEILHLRELKKRNSSYLMDDDILYMYPDIILPVCEIEANQVKLSQTAKFITELAKLKSEGIGGA